VNNCQAQKPKKLFWHRAVRRSIEAALASSSSILRPERSPFAALVSPQTVIEISFPPDDAIGADMKRFQPLMTSLIDSSGVMCHRTLAMRM
jgi:hypothetical protein